MRNLALIIPATLLIAMILSCFLGPIIGNLGNPSDGNLALANLPLWSNGHPLGTDTLGNDLLARCLYGGRASFEIGFGAVAVGFIIGSNLGVIAGYFGGRIEIVIMRILDVLLAFPALVLALAVAAYLGPSIHTIILAISFFTVPAYARISRAQALRQRSREYVVASRIMGERPWLIAMRHVYPNILPALMTFAPLGIGVTMLVEAALSFLGAGIRPPTPSWGNMISMGQSVLSTHPDDVIIPGLFLLFTVTCLNLVGEQIRVRWAK